VGRINRQANPDTRCDYEGDLDQDADEVIGAAQATIDARPAG
jgi:hypothetical protein